MTVVEFGALLINNRFAYNVVNGSYFSQVNGCVYIFSQNFFVLDSFFESRNALVLFAVDVETSAVLNYFSADTVEFDFVNIRFITWQSIGVNASYSGLNPLVVGASLSICWCIETFSVQVFNFFFVQRFHTIFSIPFAIKPVFCSGFFFSGIEYISSQFNAAYCIDSIRTWFVVSIVYELIVSVQRHPDNVTWLEVYGFAVVQRSGSFLNDVAIFVGYKQFTIKFEVARPISLVVRASAVGNSKSVSAHAKYHSRSQCYGKYFFHSLSSS